MGHFDLPLDQLRDYRPDLPSPADLRAFWSRTLDDARRHDLDATFTPQESPLRTVEVLDVSYAGFGGQRVAAWLLLPRERRTPLPCVIEYAGYGGGRGLPHESLVWSSMGYAHLVMDTRGQGSAWRTGTTPDLDPDGSLPHAPGFLTLGLPDPSRLYYRRLFTDAVRAIDAAAAHPDIDATALVTAGASQGGGLSLAASVLRGWVGEGPVAAALVDVPFLSHFRRAAEIAADSPYDELVRWLHTHRDQAAAAFLALQYVDVAVLATHGTAPSLWSVGIRDTVCPPSTVFAAHNRYGGPAEITVWEWNEHEGGQAHQTLEQARWLAQHVTPAGR